MADQHLTELTELVYDLCRHLADAGPTMTDASALLTRAARLREAVSSSAPRSEVNATDAVKPEASPA